MRFCSSETEPDTNRRERRLPLRVPEGGYSLRVGIAPSGSLRTHIVSGSSLLSERVVVAVWLGAVAKRYDSGTLGCDNERAL